MRKMNITVDVTGLELFKGVMGILESVYEKSDEKTKREIYNNLDELLGNTHNISAFKGDE